MGTISRLNPKRHWNFLETKIK